MCIDNKIYLTFDMDWACDEVMDFYMIYWKTMV